MSSRKRILGSIAITIGLGLAASCSSAQPAVPVLPTELPSTITAIPPSATSAPAGTPTEQPLTEVIADYEITFSGEGCFASGPGEVPPGDYRFKFIDRSGKSALLVIIRNDAGKTFQDNLDLQSEPGVWFAKPSWVHIDDKVEKQSQALDGYTIDIETWRLEQEGIHILICFIDSPDKELWFGAPIEVTGADSQ